MLGRQNMDKMERKKPIFYLNLLKIAKETHPKKKMFCAKGTERREEKTKRIQTSS